MERKNAKICRCLMPLLKKINTKSLPNRNGNKDPGKMDSYLATIL